MRRCIEDGCRRSRVGAYSRCAGCLASLWQRMGLA